MRLFQYLLFLISLNLWGAPSLLYRADERGNLPIHAACVEENRATIQWMVEQDPSLIYMPTKSGSLLIHTTCSPQVFQWLIQRDPDLLWKKDPEGRLPIDRAAGLCDLDVFKSIILKHSSEEDASN